MKRSRDEAQRTRIRTIISIEEGVSQTDVARRFAVCHNTVRNWIAAYERGGAASLLMSKGGRPEGNPVWDASIFEDLAKEIDKGGYWSVPRMIRWIKEHKKEDVPEQTVWYRMDKLGYSYKSARPHPVQGNKEKQAAFKRGPCPVRGAAEGEREVVSPVLRRRDALRPHFQISEGAG